MKVVTYNSGKEKDPFWKIITDDYSSSNNDNLKFVITSSKTLTLPSNPLNGSYVRVYDGDGLLNQTVRILLNDNGNNISNSLTSIDVRFVDIKFIFQNGIWTYNVITRVL
jgi:hypothetical protein